ncbi:MAG: hypothetical protein E7468_06005 [Ruminococcaceae bacterium]|nr:hypothetical protein [Oscillospiraceae bacterium]
MRKIVCFALILCCIAGILGCSADKKPPEDSVAVFYKKDKIAYGTSSGVIGQTYMHASGHEAEYAYLLNRYLKAAPGEGFAQTFPSGVSLIRFQLEGLTAKIILSDRIADFTGMELTIALTCLTQTVMSVTGCQEVIISASTKQLDGQNFVTLNRDSYLLLDSSGTIPD